MAQVARHDARVNLAIPVPPIDNELWKKAATALVFQANVLGVLNTIAINGYTSGVIVNQVTALGTNQIIINAAIVFVNALGGGSVYIEQSNYPLTASILPLANVLIYGAGPDTVLDGQALAHVFDINNVTDVHIEHLSCQTTSGGITAFNPINIRGGCQDIHLWHLSIPESDNDGIAITNADDSIHVNDVEFTTIDNYPINCDGDDCCIENNHMSGVIGNDGIFLGVNSDGCCVRNNHVHTWTGEPIDDDGDNVVEGNICTALGVPVIAWNSKGCGFAMIQAAIDHQITAGCVEILPGTFTVAGGVITLVAANTGLEIKGAGKLVTTLSSSTRHCIQLTAVVNVVIRDLAFQTTGVAVAADGVAILGASVAIFIVDCACVDCDRDAIRIAATASECFIRRNFLSNHIDRYGINNAGDDCIISGNRIINTGDDGIWLQAGGTYCIVVENRISGWTNEAIDSDEPSNNVAHNITAV